jgi:hypothetical protein
MAQPPQQSPGPIYTYVDLPELSETYADSVHSTMFDGQSLKITFAVNRMELSDPSNPATGKRYPVCRLVLPVAAATELFNTLNRLNAGVRDARAAHAKEGTSAQS